MPKSCCVLFCTANKQKNYQLKFYLLPNSKTEPQRRLKWLQAIRRKDEFGRLWNPTSKHVYVCSQHFISGLKNDGKDHPDYVPSIFPTKTMQYEAAKLQSLKCRSECERHQAVFSDIPTAPVPETTPPHASVPATTAPEAPYLPQSVENEIINVAGKKWVLGRSKVKKQQLEEVGGSGITTENKKTKRRQNSCGQCAACLRENCGRCLFCLDQKKFGGVERRKQRCINRRCLVAAKKWVVKMPKVKKQQPKKEEVVRGSSIMTENKKRKKRQSSCGKCAACLRENCGKCPFCLDKKKFGGAERQKQRCINRRCLVRLTTKKLPRWMEAAKGVEEETVTTTTKCQQPNSMKRKRQKTKGKNNKEEEEEEEEEEDEERKTPPQQVEKMWIKPWWLKRRGKRCQRESEEEEARPRRRRQTPPAAVRTKQEESVLHVSTGLTYVPPPPPAPSPPPPPRHPLSPLPKEEKEEVDIDACMMMGDGTGWEQEDIVKEEVKEEMEELLYTEDMWEQENFYDIEVQLQESDEETLTCPSDIDDNNGHVMTFDPEYEPPESISMWSSSLGPLGDESGDDVTCGRGWLQLLKVLWTTVLPAHWVVVVAEGPELQLLQCSRLSSMTNTIVHIRSNLCFFITVKARRLPDTHMLYETHKWTITHVHRLVSLLLHLEGLVVCPGSSPTCHLLLTPPTLICLPCLFQDADEEGSTDEQ